MEEMIVKNVDVMGDFITAEYFSKSAWLLPNIPFYAII